MTRIADCPLGRTVDALDGWWALEVLHEVFEGHTSPEAIAHNLGLSTDVAADRLAALRARGLLRSRGGTNEHEPTEAGLALRPLLIVMAAWGNRDLPPHRRSLLLVDLRTGREVDPVLVDRVTGAPLDLTRCAFVPGPAASGEIRARYPDAVRVNVR